MSEQSAVIVVCAIIVVIGQAIIAVGQIIVAKISTRTHQAVNSRMSEFLENAEKKFMALGELKGAATEKREEQLRKTKLPKDGDMGD